MGGRGAWSSKLTEEIQDKVNKTTETNIENNKIAGYLLKPNAKHSDDFFNAGYSEDDGEKLKQDLQELYSKGEKTNIQYNTETKDIKFEIKGKLGDKQLRFLTAWRIDNGDTKARFITGYRN